MRNQQPGVILIVAIFVCCFLDNETFAQSSWEQSDVFIVEVIDNRLQWRYSERGSEEWQDLNVNYTNLRIGDLAFGDFDGNGQTDVFSVRSINARMQWMYSSGGVSQWKKLNYDNLPITELRFGDFDGDGKTDVFSVKAMDNGHWQWRYSSGGVGQWKNLNFAEVPLTELRFGDFDGDGKTDVFSVRTMRNGRQRWRYSSGGVDQWRNLNYDYFPVTVLRFGDFNGDGKTDVLSEIKLTNGHRQLRYSSGGVSPWRLLMDEPANLPDSLHFVDINGDGKTDIFSSFAFGNTWHWRYSPSGTEPWQMVRQGTDISSERIRFGQFDPSPIVANSFVNTVGPVFMHPRCTNCHTFEMPGGTGSKEPHTHLHGSCESCHSEESTGVLVWATPKGVSVNFVDWSNKDAVTICELAKADQGEDLKDHLLHDERIIWAIENRTTPNGTVLGATPVASMAKWETLIEGWEQIGAWSCE